jgi:hypothetical protein
MHRLSAAARGLPYLRLPRLRRGGFQPPPLLPRTLSYGPVIGSLGPRWAQSAPAAVVPPRRA